MGKEDLERSVSCKGKKCQPLSPVPERKTVLGTVKLWLVLALNTQRWSHTGNRQQERLADISVKLEFHKTV